MTDLKSVVDSFQAHEFLPPYIYSNAHWQTIVGSGALYKKFFGQGTRPFPTTFERIETPDNDYFDVEYSTNVEDCSSIVLILHGLESDRKSQMVTKFASAFLEKGFAVCLISFRACNGEDNRTKRSYHMGFTEDMHYLTALLHERYTQKKLYLCGFSLGGNVILKMLGELGEEALERNIAGAAVTCVPFDPVASQGKLDVGFNRSIAYSLSFLETLKVKAEVHNARFPGLFDIEAVRRCGKIGDFDDCFIAPVYGFKDKVDYYRQSGSKWWLHKIKVPTIAVNARDDPFIEEKSLPTAEDIGDAPVRVIVTETGGHCGFYTTVSGAPLTAEERATVESGQALDPFRNMVKPHGWLPEELSRAIAHIDKSRSSTSVNSENK